MEKDKKEYDSELECEIFDECETEENVLTEEKIDFQEQELENLKTENGKLKDDYLRVCAEMENTKRRCAQEIDKNSKFAVGSFAKELLTVADNLHRALWAAEDAHSDECEALKKGVELTESQLGKVLAKFGITKMEIMDKIFDPCFHQVVQEVEDKGKPAGTVIAELQTGYMIHDRLLREAMVVVSR